MGDTEGPRYTGFHGLLVRGITALQCIHYNAILDIMLSYHIMALIKTKL